MRPSTTQHHPGQAGRNPSDLAPPAMPGTGETACPDCSGSGKRDGKPCRTCDGTGVVVEAVGGA